MCEESSACEEMEISVALARQKFGSWYWFKGARIALKPKNLCPRDLTPKAPHQVEREYTEFYVQVAFLIKAVASLLLWRGQAESKTRRSTRR